MRKTPKLRAKNAPTTSLKGFSRPESITFGDFAAEWLEAYKTLVKISTVRIREHQLLNLKRFSTKYRSNKSGKTISGRFAGALKRFFSEHDFGNPCHC
ncbi:MAG: hypothetical protein ACLVLI_05590 [Aedoeadaptatus pacaensis]